MKNLTTAIYAKCAVGTNLHTALGGRFYKHRAPDLTTYPYAVFSLISDVPDDTFTENLEDVLIQFDLYSSASSSGEVEDLYIYLKALYDNTTLTITGETCLSCRRENTILMVEDHTTPDGTVAVWRYTVDYRLIVQVP